MVSLLWQVRHLLAWLASIPWLSRLINRIGTNSIARATKPRPRPYSLWWPAESDGVCPAKVEPPTGPSPTTPPGRCSQTAASQPDIWPQPLKPLSANYLQMLPMTLPPVAPDPSPLCSPDPAIPMDSR